MDSTLQPGSLDNSVLSEADKDALEAEASGLVRGPNGTWVVPQGQCFPPNTVQSIQFRANFVFLLNEGCFVPAIAKFPSLTAALQSQCLTGCDALMVQGYTIDVENLGTQTIDIKLEVIPGLNADVVPLPPPTLPTLDPLPVMARIAPATIASPAPAAATVQQITSGTGLPPRTKTLVIQNVPAGQHVSVPAVAVVKLLTGRPGVAFVARVSTGGTDPTPRNNVEVVFNAVDVGPGGEQPAKPVAPQIFQNPGAVQAVQQRPPRTPTPTPVPPR